MSQGYMLIDGSNIGFAGAASQKLTNGDFETQAIFYFVKKVRALCNIYSMLQPIVLWDGLSWRKSMFADYKASREYKGSNDDEPDTPHQLAMEGARNSFRMQRPWIKRAMEHLGVPQVVASNLEADDLAAVMTRKFARDKKRVLLITGDKDWIQLVGPGVVWMNVIGQEDKRIMITHTTLKQMVGVETVRQWLEYKCLVGDLSDEIPGVGGIGEKGAKLFLAQYGCVNAFINGVLDGTISRAETPKKFLLLADSIEKQAIYRRNLELMDLNHPGIPAPIGIKTTKGAFDEAKFEALCRDLCFKSLLASPLFTQPFRKAA